MHQKGIDDHHKTTFLGEDPYFYESNDDDFVAERIYTDDDDDDDAVDDEVEGNLEKEICHSEDVITITERSGKDSQVMERKPSTRVATMKITQPQTKRTHRAA